MSFFSSVVFSLRYEWQGKIEEDNEVMLVSPSGALQCLSFGTEARFRLVGGLVGQVLEGSFFSYTDSHFGTCAVNSTTIITKMSLQIIKTRSSKIAALTEYVR